MGITQELQSLMRLHGDVTAPDLYLNQAFLIIHSRDRPGKIPFGEISRPQTVYMVVVIE